ncbi:MAG TPA: Holliday junction resolvase-like protein, partial [Candidatus Thermoplasmatota archaeon]|nr:Holliday junction resolvase-like protein [Candidatus Thermoplasmatota archaeon]
MDPLLAVSAGLVVAVLALVIVVRAYHDKVARLEDELQAARSSRQSLATTYGRITEQWAPFMGGYPYEPRNFRFLGSPVDGVQFEDDKVVFVEFKANHSTLTDRERRIKENVLAGRVEWLEFRVEERNPLTHA